MHAGFIIPESVAFNHAFVQSPFGILQVPFSSVPEDEVGRRYLLPGEEIEFEISKAGKWRKASTIRILSPREPIDRRIYREIGQIEKMFGHPEPRYAFLVREFFSNVQIFLGRNEIVSDSSQALRVGDWYEYGVEPPDDTQRSWQAKDAVFIQAA
jgi:hypothetical protein